MSKCIPEQIASPISAFCNALDKIKSSGRLNDGREFTIRFNYSIRGSKYNFLCEHPNGSINNSKRMFICMFVCQNSPEKGSKFKIINMSEMPRDSYFEIFMLYC